VIAAYILMQTEAGKAAFVAAALRDLLGVSETASLTGKTHRPRPAGMAGASWQ
jgi:hypothetical protein